jgi:anti-sigma B factor antagonist
MRLRRITMADSQALSGQRFTQFSHSSNPAERGGAYHHHMNQTSQVAFGSHPQPVYRQRKAPKLSLQVSTSNGVTVVYCRGRIVYREEAIVLSERIAELLPDTHSLILDLSGVEMIDSAGLGELVVVLMWVQASGCSMKLAAPSHRIQELLKLTNLESIFEIHPTLEDALLSRPVQVA